MRLPANAVKADAVECGRCGVWRACAEWVADFYDDEAFLCEYLYPEPEDGGNSVEPWGCDRPVGPDDWAKGEAR